MQASGVVGEAFEVINYLASTWPTSSKDGGSWQVRRTRGCCAATPNDSASVLNGARSLRNSAPAIDDTTLMSKSQPSPLTCNLKSGTHGWFRLKVMGLSLPNLLVFGASCRWCHVFCQVNQVNTTLSRVIYYTVLVQKSAQTGRIIPEFHSSSLLTQVS
jgi:hypothetical protein